MNAILLDFNGTLFFDSGFHWEAWAEIFIALNGDDVEVPDPRIFCGPRNDDLIKNMAPWLTPEERQQWSVKKEIKYRDICARNPERVSLSPGAEEFLDYLKESGIKFALVSASIRDNVEFYFRQFGLSKWFNKDTVVYDDGSFSNKAEMYREASKRLDVDLTECVVVEDSLTAIGHAKDCNMGCIVGIGTETDINKMFEAGADYHIDDFTQFDKNWIMK